MCLIVQRDRARLSVLQARAQAQASLGGDSAEGAFKDFIDAVKRVETKDAEERLRKQMEAVKNIKEIRFTPLAMASRKTRLPSVSSGTIRESGVLAEQMRVVRAQRPDRARDGRRVR